MRAAVISKPGGPEVLEIREVPDPSFGERDVLVRVHAAGLNRADLHQRRGAYPAPPGSPPDIPGLEYAGEIVEVGGHVRGLSAGQRVFGIVGGGAHAELIAVPAPTVAIMPDNLSWTDGGAVPESFITAHDALATQGRLGRGDRVLIHAVGSGVGLAAVQVARAIGAIPFGTSRTPDKVERARELGLEDGATITNPGSLASVAREWAPDGFDVVLDLVGGTYTAPSIALLAPKGRHMLVGLVAGASATLDLRQILSRRVSLIGTVLRNRSVEEKSAATKAFERNVAPLLATGGIRAVVDEVFPLEAIGEAHRRMESNATFGKIVLVP